MRRVVVLAVVCVAGWLVPVTQAQTFSPAGLVSGVAGLSLSQDKVEKPKVEIKDQPKPDVKPVVKPNPETIKEVKEQPKPEIIKDQPKPEIKPVPVPEVPAQPLAQQYYERTITCYKPVTKERDVQQYVSKLVPREEKYTYTVFVPVVKDVKRIETYYETVIKPVERTITVMVPVTTKEKRKVSECTIVQTEVPVKYTVLVPKLTQEKRIVCYTEVERRIIEQVVPVCKTVVVPCVDACGNCYNVCQKVTVSQKVTREICVPIKKTKEVLVNVTVCVPEERVGKSIVCKPVYTDKEILVDVTRCVAETRKVTSNVCEMVPKTREVICKVHSCEAQQQVGTRTVYECKTELVTRKVQCVEMVPFTTIERIPIIVNSCCRPCW